MVQTIAFAVAYSIEASPFVGLGNSLVKCLSLEKDKTITKSTSQLAKVIDTDNTYALRLEGDCCWELFNEKFFKGDSYKLKAKLPSGFAGIDGFPQFKALSVKKSNPKNNT